ncbi:CDP-alcohol phosphatidyltransferase family protein [Desulfopila aestuarii]|uniref:CDP-diacylglycerol---serine O-phosphatidyltransferase n=1 Tax=Desulfopila aestuarii DSM 18488 TaxID=1121416 RepID=A0A1M7YHY3_9BACT|nr:CDP-alcohol phosphatidyltransferase family protein [Desulfopila aestuarii]SHO52221.1 CDP-diacylglycerol---serine O-phosphatidyltransferase [Desulfopila aestuarii DSM 18488]
MERFIVIAAAGAIGTAFYIWFSQMMKKQSMHDYIYAHQWLLHPNAICYWRTGMAFVGLVLYFFTGFQAAAIFIFTFAAILDGVDGIVARGCGLGTKWGEWLDPMCDKLTYLPPLIGFAYKGILGINLIWILVAIEFAGQFFARHILKLLNVSGAANNFGKIKAIICFALVIFCALLDENRTIINLGDEVLTACIILSTASVVFKFIPNRLYADILSTLNFICGVTSLVLTSQGRFAWAICIIIMGQLFDLFDGRMAEKHGGTKYGPYLDDIADFVSFGLAPAYVMVKAGGSFAWIFGLIFIGGVAFRLIRFVTTDKDRTDLPPGIFNGLPSPAGALIVLGAALIFPPNILLGVAMISVALMVSHIRFAHFGRVILKEMPRPLFFLTSATIIVALAYVFKTKNAEMFGYLILTSVIFYIFAGRKWHAPSESEQ